MELVDFKELVDKTLSKVEKFDNEIVFTTNDGTMYRMFHEQDCCEQVTIDDICGNLDDLVGSPIVIAEESTNKDLSNKSESDESYIWTFYKLATEKGWVDIRWYGTSNGYYSESVNLYKE